MRADVSAGIVVGIVALPLSMALAIACGVEPQRGLYTAIVAGAVIAFLGGSRYNVSGPTAAFVVILAPIAGQFGPAGLLLATMMAGLVLVAMSLARLGRLIQFIPHPVTTGFTTGIAVVIATLQLKDFLGLSVEGAPEHYVERLVALVDALPTIRWPELIVGAATLVILLAWPRLTRKVPAALVALSLVGAAAWGAELAWPGFQVATINSRFSFVDEGAVFGGIPRDPPRPSWPWEQPGGDGQPPALTLDMLRQLAGPALAIAMLGAIESLLCAVVADGMTGQRHDPDGELFAQGIGNLVVPLFGGIAATAALARTAAGIRAGSRSPIAAIVHAGFLLAAMLTLAPLLGYLPMASLAALLLVVAWNMSELKHFTNILRIAPASDSVVLLTCFSLTVIFDMVVALAAGVMLASLLFMRRMAEISNVQLSEGRHPRLLATLPPGVVLYEVAGPLFFGAAEKASRSLATLADGTQAVILHMGSVPAIDMTGLVALQSAIARLRSAGVLVVLAGVQRQPRQALAKAGIVRDPGHLALCQSLEEAETLVRLVVPLRGEASGKDTVIRQAS